MTRAALGLKRLTTFYARAAFAGTTPHRVEGDFVSNLFIVSRWALTRAFTGTAAVGRWLDLVACKLVSRVSA